MGPKIHLMRGLPGSGKTTEAIRLARELDAVRISRDELRAQLYDTWYGGRIDEGIITEVETAAARAALRSGSSVVIDAMHLYQRYINRWQKLGYPVRIHEVIADWPTLVERDVEREISDMRFVGVDVIRGMWDKHAADSSGRLKPVTVSPENYESMGFERLDLTHSHQKDDAYIFDIDGTLAHNDGHRSFYDYTKVYDDKVHRHVADVLAHLETDQYIIIVTGRPESALPETERWLHDNYIRYDEIHSRKDTDNRPDSIVKFEILRDEIHPRYNVLGVFDDRPAVCRMWRNVGIPTFQVGDPEFEF